MSICEEEHCGRRHQKDNGNNGKNKSSQNVNSIFGIEMDVIVVRLFALLFRCK